LTDNRATWPIVVLEAGAAIALIAAAVDGDSTVGFDGLHVRKLAHERVAFTIMAVCLVACVLATVLFARVSGLWKLADALAFVGALVIGWLAASAFANGQTTFNGASTKQIGWSATLWILALLIPFVLRVSRVGTDRARGDKQSATRR
jgi:hypothetical protein